MLAWQPNHSYVLNTLIIDSGGHVQKVTTAGTSSGTIPTFNHSLGTTSDGTVVWTDQGVSVTNGVLEFSAASAVQTAQGVGLRVGGLKAGAGLQAGSIQVNKTDLSGTAVVSINNDGLNQGNISTSGYVNSTTGFRIGGAAPDTHYLRGNGTNYVDVAISTLVADFPDATPTQNGKVNTGTQSFAGTKTFTGSVGIGVDLGVTRDLFVERNLAVTSSIYTPGSMDAVSYKVNGATGADGTFITADGKTVTVVKGIITSIV